MNRLWLALNRNGGRELLLDTFAYGMAKGVPGILGLLSVWAFLRIAGESAYGHFALVIAIVNVWITFASGWFYQGLLRFGSRLTEPPAAFDRLMRAGLGLAGIVFLLTCLPHLWWENGLSAATAAGLLLGGISIVQTTLLAELQSRLQARSVLVVELWRSAGCFALAASLAWLMADGAAALLLGTALGYAGSVAWAWAARPAAPRPAAGIAVAPAETSAMLRELWAFGWPLSLWLAAQLILPLIDRTLMAAQLGLEATGKYAGMSDILTRCFSLAVFPVVQAVYPRLSQLTDRQEHAAARSLLRRATGLLLLAGAVILPALYLLRNVIVGFALPASDAEFARLVLPLAAGGFVWQAAMLVHKPLELAQKTRLMLVAMAIAVVLKAAATWLLLPALGVMGGALATLFAGLAYCGLCLFFNREWAR